MTRTRRRSQARSRSGRAPDPPQAIPARGLKISEAARLLGVEPYVLRFWETQFRVLRPAHSRSGHRSYHERDIAALKLIKRLLHDEGFTIAGANRYIREHGLDASRLELIGRAKPESAEAPVDDTVTRRLLADVYRDLRELHRMLQD
jgi:DNA-binding transcriptional MerR regulator